MQGESFKGPVFWLKDLRQQQKTALIRLVGSLLYRLSLDENLPPIYANRHNIQRNNSVLVKKKIQSGNLKQR